MVETRRARILGSGGQTVPPLLQLPLVPGCFRPVQATSSLVRMLRSVRFWPALTGSRSRMSAPWALTTSVLARSENAVPSDFWPCTMIPTQRKDALAPPLAWGISGPRAGRAHNPPSSYGEWHAWQEPNVAPEWSCCPKFGFITVSACWLSAESMPLHVCCVVIFMRRH
jgi:hypothetical protein